MSGSDSPPGFRQGRAYGRVLAVAVALILAFPFVGAAGASASSSLQAAPNTKDRGPVVVVGLGALRWVDVDEDATPHLWEFLHARDSSAGSIVVRATASTTCPIDGWLTLSAGRRTAGAPRGEPCAPIVTETDPARAPDWESYQETAEDAGYGAVPGTLGSMLADHQIRSAAIGPGALLALATTDGTLQQPELAAPQARSPQSIETSTRDALQAGAGIVVVDAAAGIDDEVGIGSGVGVQDGHDSQLSKTIAAELDTRLGTVLSAARENAEQTGRPIHVIATGLSDRYTRSYLHVYAQATIHGPSKASRGTVLPIHSSSTRQPGILQATDLLPTIADLVAVDVPSSAVGSPLSHESENAQVIDFVAAQQDYDIHVDRSRAAVPAFYPVFIVLVITLFVLSALTLRDTRRLGSSSPKHRALAVYGLACTSVPLGVYLFDRLPWWKASGAPAIVIAGSFLTATLLAGGVIAVTRKLAPNRLGLPAAIVGTGIWLVLIVDAIAGAPLQRTALMGSFATVGGRFYGVNNTSFVLLCVSSFIAAAGLATLVQPRRRWLVVAAVGLITVAVDGAPAIGADFGGPPALVPAFTIVTLVVAGVRLTRWTVLSVLGGTVAAVVSISAIDYLRPADQRTHLGRFVQSTLDGELLQIVARKAGANLSILFSSYFTIAMLATLLVVAVLFAGSRRQENSTRLTQTYRWIMDPDEGLPTQTPMLRPLAIGIAIALTIGFLVNDSGVVIPAIGLGIAVPALLSTAHHFALESRVRQGRGGMAAPAPESPPNAK